MKLTAIILSIGLALGVSAEVRNRQESLKLCDLALKQCATTVEYYEDYTKTLSEQIVLYDSSLKRAVDQKDSLEKRHKFYKEFGPYILIFSFLTGTYFGHKYIKDN